MVRRHGRDLTGVVDMRIEKRTDLGNVWGRFDVLADRLDMWGKRKMVIKDDSGFWAKEFSAWWYHE